MAHSSATSTLSPIVPEGCTVSPPTKPAVIGLSTKLICGTCGTLFASFQALAVLSSFSNAWPEALGDLIVVAGHVVMNMSFGIVKFPCFLGTSFLPNYVGRLLMPFLFVLLCASWQVVKSVGGRYTRCISSASIFNIAGLFGLVSFVMIASWLFALLECYENPNGKSTLKRYPSVICWEGPHLHVMPIFVFGLMVYIVAPVSATLYIISQAPHRYVKREFRRMTRFLFWRYQPGSYWYSLAPIIRSIMFVLVTVLFPDQAHLQHWLFMWILALGVVLHVSLHPFIDRLTNRLETIWMILLLQVSSLGIWFGSSSVTTGTLQMTLGYFILTLLYLYALMGAVSLCVGLTMRVKPAMFEPACHDSFFVVQQKIKAASRVVHADPSMMALILQQASYQDVETISRYSDIVLLEAEGLQSLSWHRRRLPQSYAAQRPMTMEAVLSAGNATPGPTETLRQGCSLR